MDNIHNRRIKCKHQNNGATILKNLPIMICTILYKYSRGIKISRERERTEKERMREKENERERKIE